MKSFTINIRTISAKPKNPRHLNLNILKVVTTIIILSCHWAYAAPPYDLSGINGQRFQGELRAFAKEQQKPPRDNNLPATVFFNSEIYTDTLIDKLLTGEYQAPLFRDELANRATDTLLRKNAGAPFPLLIGDSGVGKTAVLELLGINIVTKAFPQAPAYQLALNDAVILRVTARYFAPGGIMDLDAYLATVNFISQNLNRKIYVAIYESHFLEAEQISILKQYNESGSPVGVILETDSKSYGLSIKGHPSFTSLANPILVPELNAGEVTAILKQQTAKKLKTDFNVSLSNDLIAAIVDVSKEFRPDIHEPRRSMTLAEDFSIAWLRKHPDGKTPRKIDLYRYVAEQARLPVIPQDEKAFLRYMDELKIKIGRRVIGQSEMINGLVDQFSAALQSRTRQHSVAVVLGPTGVGKSLTPEVLAQEFYGSDARTLKVDMTQFGDKEALSAMFGASNGFISSDKEKGLMCDFFDGPGMGGGVVILNEIEEAHEEVFTRLMEMFDNGEFRGGDGKLRRVGRTLFVLTSNKKTNLIISGDALRGMTREELNRRLKGITQEDLQKAFTEKQSYSESDPNNKVIKPAVAQRVDRYYYAPPLLTDDAVLVAQLEIDRYIKNSNERSTTQLEADPSLAKVITESFYNEAFGSRQIRSAVQRILSQANADFKREKGFAAKKLIVSAALDPSQKTVSYITVTNSRDGESITFNGPNVPVINKLLDPAFRKRLRELEDKLNQEIFGQEETIKVVVAAIKARYLQGGTDETVAGFLMGMTGTGKSQLGISIAQHLFGRPDAFRLFEMGKIATEHDLQTILHPPRGIIGSTTPGQFEQFLIDHPEGGVGIFDEMSNAGGNNRSLREAIGKQFYTMIERGYYENPSGKRYDISNHVLLMTGNDGEEFFRGMNSDSMLESAYLDAIKDPKAIDRILTNAGFSPAFVGRLAFTSLLRPTMGKVKVLIARKMLNAWRAKIQGVQPFDIEFNEEFVEQIGMLMFSSASGARSIKRFLSRTLGQLVADQTLALDWDHLLKTGTRAKVEVSVHIDQNGLPFYDVKPYKNQAILTVKTSVNGNEVSQEKLDFTKTATFMPQVHIDIARATAYHEMGHAIASFTDITGKKLVKISIVPEDLDGLSALGYAQYRMVPTRGGVNRKYLIHMLAGLLAGSAAESKLGLDTTTGRSNDVERVGQFARRIILDGHMVPELDAANAYENGRGEVLYNLPPKLANIFDNYVNAAIADARVLATQTLNENWDIVEAGSVLLLKYGHISGRDFERLKAKAVAARAKSQPIDLENIVLLNEPGSEHETEHTVAPRTLRSPEGCAARLGP